MTSVSAVSLTLCSWAARIKRRLTLLPSIFLPSSLTAGAKCLQEPRSDCIFCYPTTAPPHLCGVNRNAQDLVFQSTKRSVTIQANNLSICLLLHIRLLWSCSTCFRFSSAGRAGQVQHLDFHEGSWANEVQHYRFMRQNRLLKESLKNLICANVWNQLKSVSWWSVKKS